MNKLNTVLALSILSTSLTGGIAFAQDHHDDATAQDHHDNHAYVEHKDWKKGEHIRHEDWDRGERVDYRHYHLSPPPRGYEWRSVDGNYVLANTSNFEIGAVVRIP